jgi:hypothetical protein
VVPPFSLAEMLKIFALQKLYQSFVPTCLISLCRLGSDNVESLDSFMEKPNIKTNQTFHILSGFSILKSNDFKPTEPLPTTFCTDWALPCLIRTEKSILYTILSLSKYTPHILHELNPHD